MPIIEPPTSQSQCGIPHAILHKISSIAMRVAHDDHCSNVLVFSRKWPKMSYTVVCIASSSPSMELFGVCSSFCQRKYHDCLYIEKPYGHHMIEDIDSVQGSKPRKVIYGTRVVIERCQKNLIRRAGSMSARRCSDNKGGV